MGPPDCYAYSAYLDTLGPGPGPIRGPDDERRFTCHVSYTIVPAVGLVLAPGVGQVVSLVAPGPGLLVISAAASNAHAAARPATTRVRVPPRPAPIMPVRRRVHTAGPLVITLKLNPAAARTLSHRQRLPLHLTVRFTPARGAVVVRHQRLTLISAACSSPRPKPPRAARPHKIPAGCPKHR